jgi:hypothetical protein
MAETSTTSYTTDEQDPIGGILDNSTREGTASAATTSRETADGVTIVTDKNGDRWIETTDPATGKVTRKPAPDKSTLADTAVDDPAQALRDRLLAQGYTAEKAAEIAASLLANAATQPTVETPTVGQATATSIKPGQAGYVDPIDEMTFEDANASGLGIGNTDPVTREVTENELVRTHLEGLLDEESIYIKTAKQRAMQLANARGQLGSSFAAGSAHRAAIEAALPIATADAQAYRDVATANMNALNEMALANLQRATAIDTALLDTNARIRMANMDSLLRVNLANLEALTQTNIANLDAKTRVNIANLQSSTELALQKMRSEVDLTMQSRLMTHEVGMEQLQQTGRVELALLDIDAQILLKEMGFEHDFNMSELDHQEQLEVNRVLRGYEIERDETQHRHERRAQHAQLATAAQTNYINYLTAYATSDLDANAAARLKEDAWNNLVAELEMINGLYPEFDPITPTRG